MGGVWLVRYVKVWTFMCGSSKINVEWKKKLKFQGPEGGKNT